MDDPTESGTMEYPKKLFYRINEVAKITGVETYVLRYWETDIELVLRIKELLYQDKFTIAGAVEKLQSESSSKKKGGRKGRGAEPPPPEPEPEPQTEAEDGEESEADIEAEAPAGEPDVVIMVEKSEDESSEAAPSRKESRPRKPSAAAAAAESSAPSAPSAPPPQWEVLCARAVKARKELHELIAEIKQWRGQAQ
jgi:hypothetical protein